MKNGFQRIAGRAGEGCAARGTPGDPHRGASRFRRGIAVSRRGPRRLDLTGHDYVTQPCDPPSLGQVVEGDLWVTDVVGPAGIEPTTPAV